MKKILAILFTLLILLPILSKSVVYIWFKTNQDYIAQNLCINKDNAAKPDCKGCCVLTEELNKVDDEKSTASNTNNKPKDNKETHELTWTSRIIGYSNALITETTTPFIYSYFHSNYTDQYLADIQKPPCLV